LSVITSELLNKTKHNEKVYNFLQEKKSLYISSSWTMDETTAGSIASLSSPVDSLASYSGYQSRTSPNRKATYDEERETKEQEDERETGITGNLAMMTLNEMNSSVNSPTRPSKPLSSHTNQQVSPRVVAHMGTNMVTSASNALDGIKAAGVESNQTCVSCDCRCSCHSELVSMMQDMQIMIKHQQSMMEIMMKKLESLENQNSQVR
jgi:hypothetical protein